MMILEEGVENITERQGRERKHKVLLCLGKFKWRKLYCLLGL